MAHLEYHNNLVDINELFYKSHSDIIRNICMELGKPEKIKEFEEKYLDKPKIKAKKDPNKPKKAKTSYMYYCEQMRIELKEELSNIKITEQSKKFANLWNKLDEAQKKPYQDLAEKDKSRFEDEMTEYAECYNY